MESDGFVPILAIFYAVFHPTEGTKILHQVPENSISTQTGGVSPTSHFFNFDTVKNYVIPKPQLCDKLILFKIGRFQLMGYPVNIQNPDYARNSFSFNFCFVFPYDSDTTPYELCIRRTGTMFRVLEEQNGLLSKLDPMLRRSPVVKVGEGKNDDNSAGGGGILDSIVGENSDVKHGSIPEEPLDDTITSQLSKLADEKPASPSPEDPSNQTPRGLSSNDLTPSFDLPGHAKSRKITLTSIASLIQQIYQDLNNYSECCIPLDSANSVDIKLFPILPPPLNIKAFQVPISTVDLDSLVDVNWDPTMLKILPFINGLNLIKRISQLADSDYLLTKQCIQHLMHYKCIEIVDIFQFSNIYAPTNHVGNFLKLGGLAAECQAYTITDSDMSKLPLRAGASSTTSFAEKSTKPSESTNGASRATPMGSSPLSVSPLSRSYLQRRQKNTPSELIGTPKYSNSGNFGLSRASGYGGSGFSLSSNLTVTSKTTLFYLYRSLNQGQTLKEWYAQHRKLLVNVDIRRFINFGVLHGLIYRVYSYPILNRSIETSSNELIELMEALNTEKMALVLSYGTIIQESVSGETIITTTQGKGNGGKYMKNTTNETNLKTGKSHRRVSFNYNVDKPRYSVKDILGSDNDRNDDSDEFEYDSDNSSSAQNNDMNNIKPTNRFGSSLNEQTDYIKLIKLLKGYQHFDSICTELQKSRSEVERMLENLGSFSVINS